jgi:hemolysin activation/secretion protein
VGRTGLFIFLIISCGSALAQSPPALVFNVERFEVQGDNPLDADATAAALEPFVGEYDGIDGLLGASDALESAFVAAGHNFHRVSLPPQELDRGIVILNISTFAVGEVKISGNQHFSTDNIRASLPKVINGQAPQLREVSRSLAVANQHPHKQLKVSFRDSDEQADSLDAVVNVQDKRQWNVFGNLNNIGTEDTGATRMQLGGLYSNLTGHDDILTTAITISPDNVDDVFQFCAFYQIPVYGLSGWLSGFYVRSDVDVGGVQNFFDVSGSGEFIGLNFKRSLIPVGRYKHSLSVGLQDRSFDTAISNAITGAQIRGISTTVRSRPINLRYDGSYNWTATSFDFFIDAVKNLSFGGHNRDEDYAAVRAVAKSQWKAIRFGALVTQRLPRDFVGVFRLNGQYSRNPLIPGEQLGFGGERTIRGFAERSIAGDIGLIANLELWSPPVAQLYGVRFLTFLDAGHKQLNDPLGRQRASDSLSSYGVGMRWNWQEMLALSVDYGQPLAHADGERSDGGTSKWHVNLQVRY